MPKVPKLNMGASPSKEREDLKMICVHPAFERIIREPIFDTRILDFVPRSIMINDVFTKCPRKSRCLIKELNDDKT